jgi:excisionase family DNA binding protein
MNCSNEVSETSKSFAPGNSVNANGTGKSLGRHFLSKQELALVIGVSPRTIDKWIAQKRIPFIRLSARLIKFNLERVKAALARYEIKEVGAPR